MYTCRPLWNRVVSAIMIICLHILIIFCPSVITHSIHWKAYRPISNLRMIKWNHWKHILIQIYQKYKHCASLVNTVDSILAKKEMRLLSKLCPPPSQLDIVQNLMPWLNSNKKEFSSIKSWYHCSVSLLKLVELILYLRSYCYHSNSHFHTRATLKHCFVSVYTQENMKSLGQCLIQCSQRPMQDGLLSTTGKIFIVVLRR